MNLVQVIIFLSIVGAIIFGLLASKKIHNKTENFYVAGRSLSWGIIGLALVAQAIDGNSTMAATTISFGYGFWAGAAIVIGLALSLFLLGKFFAPTLNKMGLLTLSDFFRIKYNRKIEIITSIFLLFGFGILLAGNIAAISILMQFFMKINYETAVILTSLTIVIYCIRGGILSDIYSDIWQTAIFLIGTVGMFIFLAYHNDLFGFIFSTETLKGLDVSQLTSLEGGALINWATIFALGFGNIVAIDFVSRILSAKSPADAKKGCYFGGYLTLLFGIPFAFLALYIQQMGIAEESGIPILITLSQTYLPTILSALLVAGIISVSLSTIDGAMLSMGNILTRNLLNIQDNLKFQDKEENEKTSLYFSRLSLIPIACIAMIFSMLLPSPGVLLTVAFDIMFSALLVPFIMAFFFKNISNKAALVAIIFGSITRFIFAVLTPTSFGVPNEFFYIENSIIPASMDGLGTFIAPLIALIAYLIVNSLPKKSLQYE